MRGLFGTYIYEAKVVRVVGGDTLDIEVDLGFTVRVKVRVKLARIDVYEMRIGKYTGPKEKALGIEAKDIVKKAVEGKVVQVETIKLGKYGRYIAEVRYMKKGGVQFTNLSTELVRLGYGVRKSY